MTKKETKELMYQRIVEHGNNLKAIFRLDEDPVKLCKRLRRLELKAHALTTARCNGTIEEDDYEKKTQAILTKLDYVLHYRALVMNIFVNGDARGYALKINTHDVVILGGRGFKIYTDWGGYGIIAPDFRTERG